MKLADRLSASQINVFFNEDPKIIFLSQMFSGQETKRLLLVNGYDSSIANYRTKTLEIFLEMGGIFRVI